MIKFKAKLRGLTEYLFLNEDDYSARKVSGVYAIKNKKNGKIYIGNSANIERRWKTHLRESEKLNGDGKKNFLYKDLYELNIEEFEFCILKTMHNNNKTDNKWYNRNMFQLERLREEQRIIQLINNSNASDKLYNKDKKPFDSFVKLSKTFKKRDKWTLLIEYFLNLNKKN